MGPGLVVFDLDGTLVDTRKIMQQAFEYACQAVRLESPPPFEDYVRHLGAPFAEIMRRMNLPVEMAPHFKAAATRWRHLAAMSPDLLVVLRELRALGFTLALFTGKDAERTGDLLRQFGITDAFAVVVSGDDVVHGKPDPEGLHTILARTGVPGPRAVFVGDSGNDILCARRAGVASIGVAWGMAEHAELAQARPTALVHCQHDLLAVICALFGGPR